MTDYKPDYTDRDSYFAAKDRASAERDRENAAGGPQPRAEPKAHDYRRGGWGHTANISQVQNVGHNVKMHGFGTGVCPGDYIIKANGAAIASYRVDKIWYERDPPDMWFADCTYDPSVFGVLADTNQIVRIKDHEPTL